MSKLFQGCLVVLVLVGSGVFLSAGASYKPFNYKAFEARKRGQSLIIPKIAETISPIEYLKVVPVWPGYLRFPNPDNQAVAHFEAGFSWADYSFDERSELRDPTDLFFGKESPTIADISLISRLHKYSLRDWLAVGSPASGLEDDWSWVAFSKAVNSSDQQLVDFLSGSAANLAGGVPSVSQNTTIIQDLQNLLSSAKGVKVYNRYLAYIADKVLTFKSKMRQPIFTFNYQVALLEHMVSAGFEVPVVYKTQEVNLISQFNEEENLVLSQKQQFGKTTANLGDEMFAKYPGGLKDFFESLLVEKSMNTDPKATKFGLGDITFFVNRRFEHEENWTLGLVGLGVTIPSATESSKKTLWPVHLASGGFWSTRLHGAMYWKYSKLLNPHIFAHAVYFFPGSVERRVSALINYDSQSRVASTVARNIPLGSDFSYDRKSFSNEPESAISALAEAPTQFVEYRRGPEVKLRIGNVFNEAFIRDGYLDVFGEIGFRFSDSRAHKTDNGLYDLAALVQNSDGWSAKLGAAYVYHWRDYLGLELKGTSVLAGRKVLREHNISGAMQVRF